MKNFASPIFLCVICFLSATSLAGGQSVPAQTGSPLYSGFQMPDVNGTLHYALNAAERLTFGYYNPQVSTISYATFSGNLGFITPSITKPTTVAYTGGYLASTAGQPSAFFHDFSGSQAYNTKNWKLLVNDELRYLPETPASGIYGIIGTGTATGVTTPQGVLIPFATRIENNVNGDITRVLTGKTDLDVQGYYSIERFPGYSGGIQTNIDSVSGGVIHRINSLTSVSATYSHADFSYVNVTGTFVSQGASVMYKRQLTRRFLVSLAAGPEFIDSASLTGRPATLSYTADLSASYVGSLAHGFATSVTYKRSTNGGSGITFGAINDTFAGNVTYRLTRSLQLSAIGSYSRSSGLQFITAVPINTQSVVGTAQANRALTQTFSVFVSYSGQQQSIQGYSNNGINPLNGVRQVLGFGVTYSPNAIRLGR